MHVGTEDPRDVARCVHAKGMSTSFAVKQFCPPLLLRFRLVTMDSNHSYSEVHRLYEALQWMGHMLMSRVQAVLEHVNRASGNHRHASSHDGLLFGHETI